MGKRLLHLQVGLLAVFLWSCGNVPAQQPIITLGPGTPTAAPMPETTTATSTVSPPSTTIAPTTPTPSPTDTRVPETAIPTAASTGIPSVSLSGDGWPIWTAAWKAGLPNSYHVSVENPTLGVVAEMDYVERTKSGGLHNFDAVVKGEAFYYEWLKADSGAYTRTAPDGVWSPYLSDFFPSIPNPLIYWTDRKMGFNSGFEIKVAGSETVGNVECYKLSLSGTISAESYDSSSKTSIPVTGEAWIGKGDSRFRKFMIEWTLGDDANEMKQVGMPFLLPAEIAHPDPLPPGTKMVEISTYSRLDEPIEIELPK